MSADDPERDDPTPSPAPDAPPTELPDEEAEALGDFA